MTTSYSLSLSMHGCDLSELQYDGWLIIVIVFFRIAECRWPVRWSMCSQLLSCVWDELESTYTRTHTHTRRERETKGNMKSQFYDERWNKKETRWEQKGNGQTYRHAWFGRCTESLSFKVERQTVDHVHDYIIVILGVRNFLIRWTRRSKKRCMFEMKNDDNA